MALLYWRTLARTSCSLSQSISVAQRLRLPTSISYAVEHFATHKQLSSRRHPSCVQLRCSSSAGRLEIKPAVDRKPEVATPRLISEDLKSSDTSEETTNVQHNLLPGTVGRQQSYDACWDLFEVGIMTCYGMWEDRLEGASFIVSYLDTAARVMRERSTLPVALVVEGSDGVDLRGLVEGLVGRGFRVIMPRLVGSPGTRAVSVEDSRRFQNFLGERSSFLLDFMSAINLQSVDLIVGYSFGCLPVFTVVSTTDGLFHNLALICPVYGKKTARWLYPVSLSSRLIDWSHHMLLRPLQTLWLLAWVKGRLPVTPGADTVSLADRLRLIVEISLGVNYNSVSSLLLLYERRRMPLLYVVSDADKLVDREDGEEFASLLGATEETTDQQPAHSDEKEGRRPYRKLVRVSGDPRSLVTERNECESLVDRLIDLYKNSQRKDS